MTEIQEQGKRPIAITVICIIGFIGALLVVPVMFTDIVWQVGAWYPPYLGLSTIIGLACMVGLWMMRKWAAYLYTAFAVVNQVVLLVMGFWTAFALLIPAVVVVIALIYVKDMK